MKLKRERVEERDHGGKRIRVTVVERELTPEEQLEQRLAALEARVAALEERLANLEARVKKLEGGKP